MASGLQDDDAVVALRRVMRTVDSKDASEFFKNLMEKLFERQLGSRLFFDESSVSRFVSDLCVTCVPLVYIMLFN